MNDLLLFKFAQTGMDGACLIDSSMVGIGGLVDVASSLDVPKHNEDFDQTLVLFNGIQHTQGSHVDDSTNCC